jgi:hypothetical protein
MKVLFGFLIALPFLVLFGGLGGIGYLVYQDSKERSHFEDQCTAKNGIVKNGMCLEITGKVLK